MHRDDKAVAGKPHRFRDELPSPGNRFLFEVIAEGEISEHFEEGEMAKRRPDALDVGGAQAFLTGRGALVGTGRRILKVRLELDHPGARKKKRGIGRGNEGIGGDYFVALSLKEFEERGADIR